MNTSVSYLKDLNPEQLDAATTIDGYLFILAGAGTGKTKTLVSRVAYMLDKGVSADNILLITFTNKAANELRDRVESFLGERAKGFTATTFHSLCADILRKYGHLVGLKKGFVILDESDSHQAMKTVFSRVIDTKKAMDTEYNKDELPRVNQLCHIASSAINSMKPVKSIVSDRNQHRSKPLSPQLITEIIDSYNSYLRSINAVDFDCLISLCCEILEHHEDVRKELDAKYRYISCDEYQDTNAIQDKILSLLTIDYPNLAVVGDDNQSIYSFRNADIGNILGFEKRYPSCKRVSLTTNYRSTQEILDVSNAMMKGAKDGIEKNLRGLKHGAKPSLIRTANRTAEADYIVREVKAMQYALNEIAVICRSSMQSFILESKLRIANIPFVKRGGLKFNERAVVKDVLAILRYICNSGDEIALQRILRHIPGLGDKAIDKLMPYMAVVDFDEAIKIAPNKSKKYLTEFCEMIDSLTVMKLFDMLDMLLEDGAYLKMMKAEIDDGKKSAVAKSEAMSNLMSGIEDAKTLREIAVQYDNVSDFVSDIALESARAEEDEGGKLIITTIHSAKGLEFHTVFLMDCVDGVMPPVYGDKSNVGEERRCMYVALTRAKQTLYLMYPKSFDGHGATLSHFLTGGNTQETLSDGSYRY